MRFHNKHDRKNILHNQKIAIIQKANHRSHTLLQFINNELVDRVVRGFDTGNVDEITEKEIYDRIFPLTLKATAKDLERLLSHSLVQKSFENTVNAKTVLNQVTDSLTKLEVERTIKNLNYIENVLNSTRVDIDRYKNMIEKLPYQTSRKQVIERCIVNESELPSSGRQSWLERNLERGYSHNKQYTYKELSQLSRDLERYKSNRLDYETAIMENKQADREGYDNPNNTKSWIWSTLENTRHEELDGETIPLTSKFEVVNSQTGDVDWLRFPGDVENDHNNCSNICNCACSYEIN